MTMLNHSADILWLAGVQSAQIGVLFVVVWCVCRWLLADRPYLAHGLWVLLLIKCLTPPVWSSEVGVFSWVLYRPAERVSVEKPVESMGTVVNDPRLIRRMREQASVLPAAGHGTETISEGAAKFRLDGGSRAAREPGLRWPLIALSIWIFVGFVIFVVTLGRFFIYRRRIWVSAVAHDAAWDKYLDDLRKRLGIWRPVRLVITRERVGPAVFGLLRPTIVLPEAVVESRSASELEPILAHELIHIRRGDLWIGVLQLFAGAAWWFYPPVWIAIRRVSRLSEECCDLAVIHHLPHSRRAYADLLLDVLARGQELRAIPLVPGMSAGDVTSRRLEKIMTVKSNPSRWATCLRWAVLLGVAVATLPGAGWDGERAEESRDIVVPIVAKKDVEKAADRDSEADVERLVIAYRVPRIFESLDDVGLNRKGAKQFVSDLIQSQVFRYPEYDATKLRSEGGDKGESGQNGDISEDGTRVVWADDGSLIVRTTRSVHDRIERLLSALSQTGPVYIRKIISTGVMETSELNQTGGWKNAGTFKAVRVTEDANELGTEVVEQGMVKYAIIDPDQWKDIKPLDFTSKLPQTISEFDVADNQAICNGMTGRILSVSHGPRTLSSGEEVRMMSSGIEGTTCVTLIDEVKRGESHTMSARLHVAYTRYELPLAYGVEIKLSPAKERTRIYDHIVYQETAKTEIPTTFGKTVLIRRGKPHGSLREWDGEFVIAITLKQVPTEIRLEPK